METQEQTILALDVSTTSTGYALYVGNKLTKYGFIKPTGKDWLVRVRKMADKVTELDEEYSIDTVVIEDTFFLKNIKTVKKLCLAQGILLGQLPDAELIQVFPNTWKKHFGLGKGKATRDEQKQTSISVAETLFLTGIKLNDDEADAILMGRYVLETLEGGE
jgi:Holliday junction resolvasome RuvABC endonuclease subunit